MEKKMFKMEEMVSKYISEIELHNIASLKVIKYYHNMQVCARAHDHAINQDVQKIFPNHLHMMFIMHTQFHCNPTATVEVVCSTNHLKCTNLPTNQPVIPKELNLLEYKYSCVLYKST